MHKLATIIVIAVLCGSPVAAEEVNHYIARSADMAIVEMSETVRLFTFDDKGLIIGQIDKSAFHGMNSRCNGILMGLKDNVLQQANTAMVTSANGYCKYLDKDGDAVYLEWHLESDTQRHWEFVLGTGKWKGIKGGGKYTVGLGNKTQVKGTFQNIVHVMGTYELPN